MRTYYRVIDTDMFQDRVKVYGREQFERFGPQWQAECNYCQDMSDVLDSAQEQVSWIAEHVCQVVEPVSESKTGWLLQQVLGQKV